MRYQIFMAAFVTVGFFGLAKAQDSDFTINSQPLVITGTSKGECTPDMPMVSPGVYSVELHATADKTFVLDSKELGLQMEVAPGQMQATILTLNKGNFGFTCGDKSLPENKRTQGMFMIMDM